MILVFATNNKNKIKEIKNILSDSTQLLTLETVLKY